MAEGTPPSPETVAELGVSAPLYRPLAEGAEERIYSGGYEQEIPGAHRWVDCSIYATPVVVRGPRGGLSLRYVRRREA